MKTVLVILAACVALSVSAGEVKRARLEVLNLPLHIFANRYTSHFKTLLLFTACTIFSSFCRAAVDDV